MRDKSGKWRKQQKHEKAEGLEERRQLNHEDRHVGAEMFGECGRKEKNGREKIKKENTDKSLIPCQAGEVITI